MRNARHFSDIVSLGIPIFTTPPGAAVPGDSSPYTCSWNELFTAFEVDAKRRALLETFSEAIRRYSTDVQFECALIGGSFIDMRIQDPRDIDCLIFYSANLGVPPQPGRLRELNAELQRKLIDARLCPTDCGTQLMVQMASYYTNIYCASDNPYRRGIGLLLVDLQGL